MTVSRYDSYTPGTDTCELAPWQVGHPPARVRIVVPAPRRPADDAPPAPMRPIVVAHSLRGWRRLRRSRFLRDVRDGLVAMFATLGVLAVFAVGLIAGTGW